MNEDESNQKLLKLICSNFTGLTMAEAMIGTGLDYQSVKDAVEVLCAAGHPIGVVKVGRSICRLYPLEDAGSS